MRLSKKTSIAVLLLSLFICTLFPYSAIADITPTVQGNKVSIAGDNAVSGKWVNLSVIREDGKQAYIGQVMADAAGKYQFDFCLDKGNYNYSLSNTSGQGNILVESTSGGGSTVPGEQKDTASLMIKGDAERGTILSSVSHELGKQNCSVLDFLKSVLDSQGIAYNIRGGYVVSIDGLAEKKPGYPMSGWLYSVNGYFPPIGADSYLLKNGDRVEWIYSLDGREGMKEEIKLPASDEIKQLLDSNAKQLSGLKETRLLNVENRMSDKEAAKLAQELAANKVALTKEVGAGSNYIADSAGEIAISIPDNALNRSVIITAQEGLKSFDEVDGNMRFCSSVFDFGPDGTKFAVPITIALKIAVTSDLDVNALQPAWYDGQKKEWIPIPALIDLNYGIVMFQIDHFTSFAVIESIKPNQVKPEPEHNFTDVGENYAWASEAINELAARGIIKGTGNNCFEPQRAISRAEFVQMLATAMQLEKTTATELKFKDVTTDDWFADAVGKACSKNLIAGYPDETFRPGKSISRYEVAVLLHRFYGQTISEQGAVFSDQEEIPAWAVKAVNYVNGQKLMQGYEDKSFRGNNSLNRAEAACIVYRMLNR